MSHRAQSGHLREERPLSLSVIHLDMDAFYASVEQRDDPSLRGKALVVGGSPDGRGVVSTCSYEARRFGIHSAMPSSRAKDLCPSAIFLPSDFAKYRAVARQIREIMARDGSRVESLGLDEAFIFPAEGEDPVEVARRIKSDILAETRLTCSVGVSYARPLAKLASEWRKPDGFTVMDRDMVRRILPDLPLGKLWGVGPRTVDLLARHGIVTCADFWKTSRKKLLRLLGPGRTWDLALLTSGRPLVRQRDRSRAKSVSRETTLTRNVRDPAELDELLTEMVEHVADRLDRDGIVGGTVTVKIRYASFRTLTRSRALPHPSSEVADILPIAHSLMARLVDGSTPVRLLGAGVSDLLYPDDVEQGRLALMTDGGAAEFVT